MKTFKNGWVQIAHKQESAQNFGTYVIVAMSPDPHAYERYVTGIARADGDEWFWGHYFRTIEAAVTDYSER